MFRRVNVPVLGIIENMSYFVCPSCGEMSDIFRDWRAKAEAERLGLPFLGGIPLDMRNQSHFRCPLPIVSENPASPHSQAYTKIAETLTAQLESKPPAPSHHYGLILHFTSERGRGVFELADDKKSRAHHH